MRLFPRCLLGRGVCTQPIYLVARLGEGVQVVIEAAGLACIVQQQQRSGGAVLSKLCLRGLWPTGLGWPDIPKE